MTKRWALLLIPILAGCGSTLTRAKVTITFENETQTQCVKASAKAVGGSATSNSGAVDRKGKDVLVIGVGETAELTGELEVTVSRFASAGCMGTAFDSETRNVTLMKPGMTGMLEFHFVGMTDGGVDGGVDAGPTDGGGDGGCDTSGCPAAGDCETGLPSCGCTYARADAGTACSTGVCAASGACVTNVCAALPAFSPCDAGLSCVTNAQCTPSMLCLGNCPGPRPQCRDWDNTTCATATECASVPRPSADGTNCDGGMGVGFAQCLAGTCLPWFGNFNPAIQNLRVGPADVMYPDAGWVLASPDGGSCDTVISTTGTPAVIQGDCGTPPLFSVIDDAGVAVFTAAGLSVGTNARLHFVGARPAELLVIGSATINGLISVAPTVPGMAPAGSDPTSCTSVAPGANSKQGGGGGGYGGRGGNGGESGATGGSSNTMSNVLSPLRGGCSGSSGFKSNGANDGGIGGGAFELIVSDALTLSGGSLSASGGGGAGATMDSEGGGGGGSGGSIIVFAKSINLTGGAVTSNGGNGGEGGGNDTACSSGATGSLSTATSPAAADSCNGGNGGVGAAGMTPDGTTGGSAGSSRGGGGGGGGVGVIFVGGGPCTRGGGVTSGATPLPFSCN